MPDWFLIPLTLTVVGAIVFLVRQVNKIRMQKRNLVHWAKDEPLEGDVDRWD